MSACQPLVDNAAAGVAPALRAVDCMTGEATAAAFTRLFGSQGVLLPVLTLGLTLYIAFFALSLMTGRTTIGARGATERMLLVGLVLTFATSWLAYQEVVWNLAVGGPDQIAGTLLGSRGPATLLFADRIDMAFSAIADAASSTHPEGTAAPSASFSPDSLVWLSAVLLMLGTVGVLVTSHVIMAALLALGPVFVLLALFGGTRGLFAGWLRALVLSAMAPLLAVLGGSLSLELAVPVIARLRAPEGIEPRSAFALLLIAAVHVVLMVMAMRVAGTLVSAWNPGRMRRERLAERGFAPPSQAHFVTQPVPANTTSTDNRRIAMPAASTIVDPVDADLRTGRTSRPAGKAFSGGPGAEIHILPTRASGIGSRFRPVRQTGRLA